MTAVLRVEERAANYAVAPILTDHLDTFASAPDGFKRLRELVLNLAVRGRLVPQDPKDESASELLKRIASDKAQLIGRGEIRRGIPTSAIAQNEEPYRLPTGWKWARLAELTLAVKSGGTPSKNNPSYWDGPIRWASVKDLGFGEPIASTQDSITDVGLANGSVLVQPGAIIVCTRMGLGKIGEAKIPLAINQDLKALQLGAGINKAYFISFFKTLSLRGTGMTVSGIKQDELLGLPVPLPPLTEQSRIVAKVEELMALIDRLEAKVSHGETARGKLLDALLATLADSPDAAATSDAWVQLAPHFDLLLQTPADVDRLQQTLLTLAVKGRLVPQDPNDEPAAELLKRIRAEKERLIAVGKIKREKPLSPIGEEELLFGIPKAWQWARLGEVLLKLSDGTHHSPPNGAMGAYMYVTAKNIKNNGVDLKDITYVSDNVHREIYSRCNPEVGDVLYIKDGATTGIACINQIAEPFSMLSSVALLKPSSGMLNQHLLLVLRSPFFYSEIREGMTGVAITRVTLSRLQAAAIPLPPLAEQSRIVAAVASLTALCDRLRERLAARRDLSAKLAAALTEGALS